MSDNKKLDDFLKKIYQYSVDGFPVSTIDDRILQIKLEKLFQESLLHFKEQKEQIEFFKHQNEILQKEILELKIIPENEPNNELILQLKKSKSLLSRFTYDPICGVEFKKQVASWLKDVNQILKTYQNKDKAS